MRTSTARTGGAGRSTDLEGSPAGAARGEGGTPGVRFRDGRFRGSQAIRSPCRLPVPRTDHPAGATAGRVVMTTSGQEGSRLDTGHEPTAGRPSRPRQTELRTERLWLRPPDRTRDLADVVLACSDPDVAHFVSQFPSPFTSADAQWLFAFASTGDWTLFVIVDALTETFLGLVMVDGREGGELGYLLAPEVRGRGLMTEAVRAVVCWAHTSAGVGHLFLKTHPANVSSQRVAERAGFVKTGMLTHDPPLRGGRTESFLYEWWA
jgi:RimJ/RimL family protein N-acetyltransferase